MSKLNLTKDQEHEICFIIGEWYLKWRHCIADYESKTHNLGYAKEKLKEMICEWDKMQGYDENYIDMLRYKFAVDREALAELEKAEQVLGIAND